MTRSAYILLIDDTQYISRLSIIRSVYILLTWNTAQN